MGRFLKYPLIMPVTRLGMFQTAVARQHSDPRKMAIVPLNSTRVCLLGVGMVRFLKYPLILPVSMHGMFQTAVARQHGDTRKMEISSLKSQWCIYWG